jgi:RNA polymerase sigma-70 factor (ECF subfamily)
MTEDVLEEFYPKVYNYVYYRILHRETAEDITSEIFYKAVANKSSFDPRRASYSTWLFTIAHNCVANYYRDKKNRKNEIALDNFDDLAAETSMDDNLIAAEEAKRLYSLLKTLSERERTILALRFWSEFSYAEIAAQLKLTEKNVGVILSRTIAKLKSLW